MRRAISSLAVAGMLGLIATAPVGAAADPACTRGDVQALATGTYPIYRRGDFGRETGSGNAWLCGFRLYDGNDDEENPDNPEVPNVFSTKDWFLGGIFMWITREDMESLGYNRADAVAYMNSIE